MEDFPNVRGLEIFPAMESNTLEFKETFSATLRPKITATICSFLNAKGGHIVCGVEDRERRIVGLKKHSAELDVYLRWFDDFYHGKRITDSEGAALSPGEVEARIVEVNPTTHILVVTVRPTSGKSYKTREGISFVRLGASVYKYQESSSLDLLEKELEQEIRDTKRKVAEAEHTIGLARQEAKAAKEELKLVQAELKLANQEKNRLASQLHTEKGARHDYGRQLAELRADMRTIVGAAKGVEERLDLFVGAMEKEILEKKAVVEEELAAQRRSWWCCF